MFIVEGLDYAGKSTALKQVQRIVKDQRWARWFGDARVHAVQAWGKLPPEFDYCWRYVAACRGPQLCDRFVLSELAYGAVFRGGPNAKFDSHARRRVARMLNVTGTVTLLVRADWATTEARARERCVSEFDAAMKIRQTYEQGTAAFDRALEDLALGRRGGSFLGVYDTSALTVPRSVDVNELGEEQRYAVEWYVMQWKTHLERSMLVTKMCPKSWGYLWPKVLLVGENINHPTSAMPFAGDHGASRTLTDLLDAADVGEKDIYLWNAYDYAGHGLLTREGVATLQPRLIVALGKVAHEYLETLGVKHVEFPHPQWIGRFHRKEMNEWGLKLKTLVAPALASST